MRLLLLAVWNVVVSLFLTALVLGCVGGLALWMYFDEMVFGVVGTAVCLCALVQIEYDKLAKAKDGGGE